MFKRIFSRKEPGGGEKPSIEVLSTESQRDVPKEGSMEPELEKGTLKNSLKIEKDKTILDLLSAVEHIVRERQLADHNLKDLHKRQKHSQEQIDALQKEVTRANQAFGERDNRIAVLEEKLADKNVSIDQLMEDYGQLQSSTGDEIRGLKSEIELREQKYQNCVEKSGQESMEKTLLINNMEAKLMELETERNRFKTMYDNIRKENTYLLNLINDFTHRMSSSLTKHSGEEDMDEMVSDELPE